MSLWANYSRLFSGQYYDKLLQNRVSGLDTLRAFAICLVFMYHYPMQLGYRSYFGILGNAGWVGVDLFFVLSGYLIGNQIFSSLVMHNSFDVGNFFYRRLMRTLPNYLFVLALYFLLPGFSESPIITPLWKFLSFTQNFNLYPGAFSHAWSLCVEEQFYFILPLLSLFIFYKGSAKTTIMLIVGLLISQVIIRALIWQHYSVNGTIRSITYFITIYFPTYTRLTALILGVSVALIKNFRPLIWAKILDLGNYFLLAGIICTAISFYFYRHVLLMFNFYPTVYVYPLLCIGFTFLTIAALCPNSYLYKIHIPGAKTIAILSYAMYLIQKPMIFITIKSMESIGIQASSLICIPVAIILTLIASWLIYESIEKPFLKLRERKIRLQS